MAVAVDPRQVLSAFLTLSMFAMLASMIKRDHFQTTTTNSSSTFPGQVRLRETSSSQLDVMKIDEPEVTPLRKDIKVLWKETTDELKPCWTKPHLKEVDQAEGFVTFSLTNGPEYHISQVADAVVIARYLGATLVLPDIRGTELGQKRNFQDMYDVKKFMKSMDGVIKIATELPADFAAKSPVVLRVPSRVSKEFIVKNIEPVFLTNNYLRLASFFPSTNMKVKQNNSSSVDSTMCLAMYGSLELKPDIREVAELMVERLRTLSRKQDGNFVAVDLRIDLLEKKSCRESGSKGKKSCYNSQEICDFLQKIGFKGDTAIYLTQTSWHEDLNALKNIFPKTYTKEDIIPADKKASFLGSGHVELERALDLHICTHSDVFVPAISGLFYGNVVGKRISSGKIHVIVPSQVSGAATAQDFISTYISRKNHLAYSCYC